MKSPFVAILLLAGAAVSLPAQSVRFTTGPGSRITVAGTSNVHDWKCSTSSLTSAIAVASGELGKGVESLSISVPVRSLDCGNGQMNTNLGKALHSDKHPTISYRMTSYTARPTGAGSYQATIAGSLTINGVTRPVSMNATTRASGAGAMRAEGSMSFSTKLFGVEPVKAMLGAIKTGERVTISVTIAGSAPVTVAAAPPPRAAATVKVPTPVPTAPAKVAVAPRAATPVVPKVARPVPARAAATVAIQPKPVRDSTPIVPRPIAAVAVTPMVAAPAVIEPVVIEPAVVEPAVEPVVVSTQDSVVVTENSGEVVTPAISAADSTRRFGMSSLRIQYARPRDQRGVLMFESPKQDTVSYNGFILQWGAAFTQEMQALHHRNTAQPVLVAGVDQNALMAIGGGFNNAVANLYLDAQLARGIRVALTSYLSSRHHPETWVKDGYFLIDASPIEHPLLEMLMEMVTLKLGHFEVNYGDAHFRRTDNGHAIYNPLIGNLILDGFTTEIGAEGYARLGPVFAMGGVTGGEIRGQVTGPERRSPAWLGKVGLDRQMAPDLRVRLTASTYGSAKSRSNTLYTGDRGGSPYFMVIENTAATEAANAWSGNIRPGFANVVHAYMMNSFVKYRGLEFFGTIETATGKATAEVRKRTMRQIAGEGIARFGSSDQLYVAARFNRVGGQLAGFPTDIHTDRVQMGGGWFVLPAVLAKVEYVSQRYNDFPVTDIRNGGRFNGIMFAGSLAF